MDLLFVLIAVCPAVILANYDLKRPGFTWKAFVPAFAGWFYKPFLTISLHNCTLDNLA